MEEGEEEDRGRQRPERGWGEEGRSAEGMGALRVLVGKLKREERGGERKLWRGRPEWYGSGNESMQKRMKAGSRQRCTEYLNV